MKCLCCSGEGGEYEPVLWDGFMGGPYYECKYCNGSGKTGLYKWLIWKYQLWNLDYFLMFRWLDK